jgi:hypothetical protein
MMMNRTSIKGEVGGLKAGRIESSLRPLHRYFEEAGPTIRIESDYKPIIKATGIPPGSGSV